jgi:hypothetical protein
VSYWHLEVRGLSTFHYIYALKKSHRGAGSKARVWHIIQCNNGMDQEKLKASWLPQPCSRQSQQTVGACFDPASADEAAARALIAAHANVRDCTIISCLGGRYSTHNDHA